MKNLINLLIIIALCMISTGTNAQDVITKTDGSDISAKVLEITITEVKYKKFENLSGPIFTLLKSDVLMIRYENGTKDIFNETVFVEDVSTAKENTYENNIQLEDIGKGEMIIGEEIKFEKGFWMNKIIQNDRKLKFNLVYRTLQEIDVCEENMEKVIKYKNRRIVFTIIATLTMPAGYIVFLAPLIIYTKKEQKYLLLAIEDYNNSLK
ncbi:MAG: hypothetical protein K8R54_04855 [Bacteroidales bacterium]|nr:hypothetical protein [Bacteroidales bacterium]